MASFRWSFLAPIIVIILVLLICVLTFLQPSTCTTTKCKLGESTSITCQFDKNIKDDRRDFTVVRELNDGRETNVLSCTWSSPDCITADGFQLDKDHISDKLSINIQEVKAQLAGVYKCHLLPADLDDQTTQIALEIEDTENEDKPDGNDSAISSGERNTKNEDKPHGDDSVNSSRERNGRISVDAQILNLLYLILIMNACQIIIVIVQKRSELRGIISSLFSRMKDCIVTNKKKKETDEASSGSSGDDSGQDTNETTEHHFTKVDSGEEGACGLLTMSRVADANVSGNALERSYFDRKESIVQFH